MVPSASLVFSGIAPPLGLGAHPLQLSLSKVLAAPPLLLFTPYNRQPLSISLVPSSPTIWTGTLTVTSAMNSGTGIFSFQGADFSGNVGTAQLRARRRWILLVPPALWR